MATALRFARHLPGPNGSEDYNVRHVPAGFGLMFTPERSPGLLGIGSGAVKVLAMDRAMRIPFKVSTTTSDFMIGVTAAASAGVYLSRGYIRPSAGHASSARRIGADRMLGRENPGAGARDYAPLDLRWCHRSAPP